MEKNHFDFYRMDALRRARGWTWQRLGRICLGLGWNTEGGYLMKLRRGHQPQPSHLATLADALEVPASALCTPPAEPVQEEHNAPAN